MPITQSLHNLSPDSSSDSGPTTAGNILIDPIEIEAGETLNGGAFVCIVEDAGVPKLMKASNASFVTAAIGFVKAAATAGSKVVLCHDGINDQVGGLSIGRLWLGINGQATNTPPSTPGVISQSLGSSYSSSKIIVEIQDPILLA